MIHETNPATLLLVDDDKISLFAIQRALRKLGIRNETLIAHDGLQAWDALEDARVRNGGTLPPFIVVLDMHMPRMDGAEFLTRIGQSPGYERLVIFAFTSADSLATAPTAARQQVSGYLNKDNPQDTLAQAFSKIDGSAPLIHLPA